MSFVSEPATFTFAQCLTRSQPRRLVDGSGDKGANPIMNKKIEKRVAGKSARVANKSVAFEEATMPSSSKTILNQISGLVVENVSFLSVSLAPTVACVSGASSGWVQSVDTCKHFLTFSYPVISDVKLASALPSARLYPTLTPWPHWKWCVNACSVAVVSALHFLRRHRAAAYARAASLDSRRFYWVILWLHHVLRTCNFITGAQSSNVKSPPAAATHSGSQTHRRVREGERETWREKKGKWNELKLLSWLKLKYSVFRCEAAKRTQNAGKISDSGTFFLSFSYLRLFTSSRLGGKLVSRYFKLQLLTHTPLVGWFSWVAAQCSIRFGSKFIIKSAVTFV